jgi:23S rRNA (guanine2445-N2)-methyltransferase / 23S rRNA (guanine2069-N7)-methyltransferase
LVTELAELGIQSKPAKAAVHFKGDLELAYRACLWSRLANRVFLILGSQDVNNEDELYRATQTVDWSLHLTPEQTLKVAATVARSNISHSRFAALKTKDAIVDQLRDKFGARPSVAMEQPDVQVNVFIDRNRAQFSIDLSGDSLHLRGYRTLGGVATLKENLAAALLYRTGWHQLLKQGHAFVDVMCGSGTLPIEAAMMACDIAPGLKRRYLGFLGWRGHNAAVWNRLKAEAEYRREKGLEAPPVVQGCDNHKPTLEKAVQHAEQAGVGQVVKFIYQDVLGFKLDFPRQGLLVTNAPYGKRVGEEVELHALYEQLGQVLKDRFNGWRAGIFTDDLDKGKALGLRAKKIHSFFNGNIECKLLTIEVSDDTVIKQYRLPRLVETENLSDAARGLANRLQKNRRKLAKWLKSEQVSNYRIYDADLPDYSAAIDIYGGPELIAHVQEYEAPKSVDEKKAARRLAELLSVVRDEFALSPEQIFLKQRRRQKGSAQYEKQSTDRGSHGLGSVEAFTVVEEGGLKFYVNFEKYLDTGLFLDHRPLRSQIFKQASGKSFLNLFAYTGSISVYAAAGGATRSMTLDMSNTYLEWTRRNFALNNISSSEHKIERADCVEWLNQPAKEKYDLIVLDPPSFSNSKRMSDTFDVQRDHVSLVKNCMSRLNPAGSLYFSNNRRSFKLDHTALANFEVEEISHQTVPPDFQQKKHIHRCWRIKAGE